MNKFALPTIPTVSRFVSARFLRFLPLPVLALAAMATFDQPAMADLANYNCSQKINGKTIQVIALAKPGSDYDVKLSVDGRAVPLLGGRCFQSSRPSTRYLLCTFKDKNFELDLYPWVQTTSGSVKAMQFVIWSGDQASTSSEFTNCTHP